MAISVAKLSEYMNHGLNIYITGKAGTGKTLSLKAAAKKSNLNIGYMSAPTLDAYVDLVGIPIAKKDKVLKRRVLEFIRKKEFTDIEVLFIDELPRGELKTLNAIFEVIQFGTINGEIAMPKLKCVVAAGNPMTEEYTGQAQLDAALLDRFDIYLETTTEADLAYFVSVFDKKFAKALVDWQLLHDHEEKGYLSPRRLEKIGSTWLKMPDIGTLKSMMPPGGDFNVDLLQKTLEIAVKGAKIQADPSAPLLSRIPFLDDAQVRSNRVEILDMLPNLTRSELSVVTEAISRSLKKGVRVEIILRDWVPALEYFSTTDKSIMMATWSASQNAEFQRGLGAANISIGKNLISVPTD